ncbi:helix-turn-helix transcriptional regulator [Clostridium sp. C2-6-12]|uniref:helix-turn-helix domain-containing protein n=1 Tax=Clostridium sp. C2-6-12 TaxID=2698832 RepID=UPI0013720674|nr:helix-turn-helix transcriptional regulator [Clostridium sp. C2-6-12]
MNIGENIKKYRKLAHITQVQLAQKINKSESTIRKYEANNVKPDFSVLDDIASVLGCSLIDLVNDTDTSINSKSKEISEFFNFNQYIKTLGYGIDGDESEGYLIINAPDGTYEITEKSIEELTTTTKAFVSFKLQEIIKSSRKIGK